MMGIHESWEDNISKEEKWAKINTERKYRRILRRTVTKNQASTAAQVTAELNIRLQFSQKVSDVSFTNPTFTAGLQFLNL
jgi:hypothetical protein